MVQSPWSKKACSGNIVFLVLAPLLLSHVVFFYYNGKKFCLRRGEEHRQLKLSQLKRTDNHTFIRKTVQKTGLEQLPKYVWAARSFHCLLLLKLASAVMCTFWIFILRRCHVKPLQRTTSIFVRFQRCQMTQLLHVH